ETAEDDMVVHFAGDYRLRDPKSAKRIGLPAADRWLRERQSADPEKHQERRNRRARARFYSRHQEVGLAGARRLYYWLAGRNARDHRADDQFRQGVGRRDYSGFPGARLARH